MFYFREILAFYREKKSHEFVFVFFLGISLAIFTGGSTTGAFLQAILRVHRPTASIKGWEDSFWFPRRSRCSCEMSNAAGQRRLALLTVARGHHPHKTDLAKCSGLEPPAKSGHKVRWWICWRLKIDRFPLPEITFLTTWRHDSTSKATCHKPLSPS